MKIYYRILNINDNDHSLVVRYWTDNITELSLCSEFDKDNLPLITDDGYPVRCRSDVSVTFYNNLNPSQNAIVEIIKVNAPVDWFRLLESVKDPDTVVNLNAALPLKGIVQNFDV